MPIAYIQRTRERYAKLPPYRWAVNHDAPWTPLAKPLEQCRLTLISSGGFYVKDQPPFEDDRDISYRIIPKDVDLRDLRIYHHGYRDEDAVRDPNCVFPLDRLREFVGAGVIGELTDAIGFVFQYVVRREVQERAPKIAAELHRMGTDVAFLVPV